ncbi:conjugative transfer ATPase [Suttonella ornithocola]|uniref:Conjugal transfer ATPase TrbE n=1 Tax=Suttonella ornithocola TaxID=279832 RepID=A0A380MVT1_9GAMM|nr:conjugative transfer ATPase [Suttonella ornithocola]SUO96680.1 conjugal transfer ATPase TrbE [Suttonella ornithocola]
MNALTNLLLRLSGIAPFIGPIPLSEVEHKNLFKADLSFVDHFPVVGFNKDTKTFELDDGINVGAVWELSAADMDAKPEDTLSDFSDQLASALQQLPQEDTSAPYIVQIYVQSAEIDNLGDYMIAQMPNHLKDDKLSLSVAEMMRQHHKLITHEQGAFPDSRTAQDKGWRVSTQKIYLCVYRIETEAYWKKQRKTPEKKLIDDMGAFLAALNGLRISSRILDDYELINWLASYFSVGQFEKNSRAEHESKQTLASYDVGQQCFMIQPSYVANPEFEEERGIWRFGKRYIRYLTTQGLNQCPMDGCLTLGKQLEGGQISASVWEQMPPGTMMCWTIIPQAKAVLDDHIDKILISAQKTSSESADYAEEQALAAKKECSRNHQRIYYTQIGAYLSANSKDELLERTLVASDVLKMSRCLDFIRPEYDLISQDSFIKSLPFVYDFKHDRNNALRARMTYLSQLAATLPLFGAERGSNNLCYLMFKRNGEPFMCNPYLKSDRSRVAHQVVFGPTGAGKSATMNYMTIMSMAMNGPRQFILDKGRSFELVAQYYESMGKKVRRLTFNAASTDTFPPFYSTKEALREIDNANLTLEKSEDSEQEEEEERSYLSEMLNILKIMVTGGRKAEADAMKQSDINFLQEALISGLRQSVKNNDPHARPEDVYNAMIKMAEEEEIEALKIRYRDLASSVQLWTRGPRGKLFNQHGTGFDADADLTLIETGSLTNEGNEDMFAIAGLATLTNITALGEKTQADGRHIEVFLDEGHYWMRLGLLIRGMIQATKVWRKLGIWLIFATQDFSDFDNEAKKILSQSEFWWLLSMGEDEASQVSKFKDLTKEQHYLIRQAIIEKPYYTEGTLLSDRFGCGLNRYIPPSLILALAQTDQDEKSERKRRMKEQGITELEAAIQIGQEIDHKRREWQEQKGNQS